MDAKILREKILEYQNKAAQVSESAGTSQAEELKKCYQTLSTLYRMAFRMVHKKVSQCYTALRAMERAQNCMKQEDIAFPLGKAYRNQLFQKLQRANIEREKIARHLIQTLDNWQSAGATLEEFAHFCNRTPEWVKQRIESQTITDSFGMLLAVYQLDFKDPRNKASVLDEIDAPLTLAGTAVMNLPFRPIEWTMDPSFQKLIREHSLSIMTDANGQKHIINKKGVDLGILQ